MKPNWKPIIALTVFLVIFLSLPIVKIILNARFPPQYAPKNGEWYCPELQIQISFERTGQTWVIRGDEKVQCQFFQYQHTPLFHIQELDENGVLTGDYAFVGKCVRLDERQFVVKDEDGREFIFRRIN